MQGNPPHHEAKLRYPLSAIRYTLSAPTTVSSRPEQDGTIVLRSGETCFFGYPLSAAR